MKPAGRVQITVINTKGTTVGKRPAVLRTHNGEPDQIVFEGVTLKYAGRWRVKNTVVNGHTVDVIEHRMRDFTDGRIVWLALESMTMTLDTWM